METKLTRLDYENVLARFIQGQKANQIDAEVNEIIVKWLRKKIKKFPKPQK